MNQRLHGGNVRWISKHLQAHSQHFHNQSLHGHDMFLHEHKRIWYEHEHMQKSYGEDMHPQT